MKNNDSFYNIQMGINFLMLLTIGIDVVFDVMNDLQLFIVLIFWLVLKIDILRTEIKKLLQEINRMELLRIRK